MPAPQLHLTFAELCASSPRLERELREPLSAHPRYLRLGAIFHDLPYYTNIVSMAIGYGLKRPAEVCPWGVRAHSDRPGRLARCFVEAAARVDGLTAGERLALVGGLFSHVALDLTLHPLVNHCARRDARRYGGAESHHHRLVEKAHSHFFHVDRYGADVIGSPAFYAKTWVAKRSSLVRSVVEQPLVDVARAAFQGCYGEAPSAAEWTGWVRCFRRFGLLVSGRLAARNGASQGTPEQRRRYYDGPGLRFADFFAVAERRGPRLIGLAAAYLAARDFSARAAAAFERAAAIDDLAFPDPVGLPALPGQEPARASEAARAAA